MALMIALDGCRIFCFFLTSTPPRNSVSLSFHQCECSLQLFSLFMDGTTGAIQDRIRARFSSKSHSMMLYMNLFSIAYSFIGLFFKRTVFILHRLLITFQFW